MMANVWVVLLVVTASQNALIAPMKRTAVSYMSLVPRLEHNMVGMADLLAWDFFVNEWVTSNK